jgi:hypothetical protein
MRKLSLLLIPALLCLAVTVMADMRAPTENTTLPLNKWLNAQSYPEEIGTVALLSDKNIMRVDDIYACDPLSNYGLLMETGAPGDISNGKVAELHYVHNMIENKKEYVWKVNVGSERLNVPTISFVAQSYETRKQQQLFEFGADGYVWLCGQRTDIQYPDLIKDAGQCPYVASAIEIKVRMYPENQLATFQLINRGITSGFNKLYGPYPLITEIAKEGIDRCIVKARPNSGTNYIDGVICKGTSLAMPIPETDGKVITRE